MATTSVDIFRSDGSSKSATRKLIKTTYDADSYSFDFYKGLRPDGRGCKLCGSTDDSPDPYCEAMDLYVIGSVVIIPYRKWGYPPKCTGVSEGCYCWYCVRAWQGQHKHRIKIGGFAVELGSDDEKHQAFLVLVSMVISYFVKLKKREGPCPWQEFNKVLTFNERNKLEIEDPEDSMLTYADYEASHGDPTKNGKGHSETSYKACFCLFLNSLCYPVCCKTKVCFCLFIYVFVYADCRRAACFRVIQGLHQSIVQLSLPDCSFEVSFKWPMAQLRNP
jgi:hypothetical protein